MPGEGLVFGGVYYPKHQKENGAVISARFETSCYVNHMNYTDPKTNQRVPGRRDVIRIVAWNGQNAQPGRGLADIFAKAITPGKELSAKMDMRTYSRKVYLSNGHRVLEIDGITPVEIPGMIKFYVNRGQFIFGSDSAKFIEAEIADGKRPRGWNILTSAEHQAWLTICAERNASVWQGAPIYGFAQVLPAGQNVRMEYALDLRAPIQRRHIFTPTVYGEGAPGFAAAAPGFAPAPAPGFVPVHTYPATGASFVPAGGPAPFRPATPGVQFVQPRPGDGFNRGSEFVDPNTGFNNNFAGAGYDEGSGGAHPF
jgi:hypothetical protein